MEILEENKRRVEFLKQWNEELMNGDLKDQNQAFVNTQEIKSREYFNATYIKQQEEGQKAIEREEKEVKQNMGNVISQLRDLEVEDSHVDFKRGILKRFKEGKMSFKQMREDYYNGLQLINHYKKK